MLFQSTCASPVLHIDLSDQSRVTHDILHLEGWHFMQNTFFFPELLVNYGHRLSRGCVNTIIYYIPDNLYSTMQETRISMFLALSFLLVLALKLPLACYSKCPSKTRAPHLLARQVCWCCFTGSVAEGPLGVAGKGGCAAPWSSEEVSFLPRLLKCGMQ